MILTNQLTVMFSDCNFNVKNSLISSPKDDDRASSQAGPCVGGTCEALKKQLVSPQRENHQGAPSYHWWFSGTL